MSSRAYVIISVVRGRRRQSAIWYVLFACTAPRDSWGEAAHASVGRAAEGLACRDAAVRLEQMREREGRELEHPCRLARVKDADEVEAKVSLQPEHVRIAPVQHLAQPATPGSERRPALGAGVPRGFHSRRVSEACL